MSYFNRQNCHEHCSVHIKKYLETKYGKVENRAVETRLYNILECPFGQFDERNWDEAMDVTRDQLILNGKNAHNKPITYFHLVISPSPEDKLDVIDVLELGEAFIKDAFGEGLERGKLGCAQAVMVAHTDSERTKLKSPSLLTSLADFGIDNSPIPHVHIIINNVDLQTRKCLHFNNADNKWMYKHIQELCEERGYHSFSVDEQKRREQKAAYRKKYLEKGAYITKAERKITKQGNYSWKFDIRNRIRIATIISRTEEEFISNLKKLEVTCTKRDDGDYLYTLDKNPTCWKSTGFKLGSAYVPSSISRKVSQKRSYNEEAVRENLIKHLETATTIETSADVTIDQVVNVLKITDKYKCWNKRHFDIEINALEKRIASCKSDSKKTRLQKDLDNLMRAKTDSENMKIYRGVVSSRDVLEKKIQQSKNAKQEKETEDHDYSSHNYSSSSSHSHEVSVSAPSHGISH